ncbi:MAG: DUF4347 domain-containing protein, partial [Planctomycetales bacterium]|nr:DUF4347 domain-containing protein [Planctomycetales bacterium]
MSRSIFPRTRRQRSLRLEDLEVRCVLAASSLATLDANSFGEVSSSRGATDGEIAREIVIMDSRVPLTSAEVESWSQRVAGQNIEFHWLSPDRGGLSQIHDWLDGQSNIDALHIVSHGRSGALQLGSGWLDASSFDRATNGVLTDLGNALADDADILLYGCDVGAGPLGASFVDTFAQLTGADVAASIDATGPDSLGGDWELEYRVGRVTTDSMFDDAAQQALATLLAPTPTTSLSVAQPTYIGETVALTATFTNTGGVGETGYGPFLDIVFPVNGADGAAGTDTADGLDFVTASYLGSPVTATELVFPDDGGGLGTVTHPYAVDSAGSPLTVTGTTGDKLVVLQLPFGSFAVGQPTLSIDITASLSNLADPYDSGLPAPNPTELTLVARAGFEYGADPLDNPTTDPTILSQSAADSSTWTVTDVVQPTLIEMTKNYIGPEDETATGPNFVRSYRIDAFVATGQTVTDLTFTDLLPNTFEYADNLVVNGGGSYTVLQTPSTPGAQNPPDNDLIVRLDAPVVGLGPSTPTVSLTFDFFVPLNDANGNPVLNATTGDDVIAVNDARIEGDWTAIDTRDQPAVTVVRDVTNEDHRLEQQSIAVQKSVGIAAGGDTGSPGVTPGDILEYSVDFQVSDFFAFENVTMTDVISDGQDWYTTHPGHASEVFVPTLQFTEHGTTVATAPFSPANYSVTENADGTTTVFFNISQELIDRAGTSDAGELLGGWIAPGGTGGPPPDGSFDAGATTGRIVFRTLILEDYKDATGIDSSIDEGDDLDDSIVIAGDLLHVADLSPQGTSETDDSSAGVTIITGVLTKHIYAINGNTSWEPIYDLEDAAGNPGTDGNPELVSGDLVTYRLTYALPTSDVEQFRIEDFLPLPVFDSTGISASRGATSATPPAENQWHLHPSDTFTDWFEANASSFISGGNVNISTDANSNS